MREDVILECKAAFLTIYDDVSHEIQTEREFLLALQQTGRNPTLHTVKKYWTSKTESMTFDEFCDVCLNEPLVTEDDLMKLFERIDLNKDGYLSLKELYKSFTTRGEKMSIHEVKHLLDDVDENKDGRLDYKEFCKLVLSTTEECKRISQNIMELKNKKENKAGHKAQKAVEAKADSFFDDDGNESGGDDDDDDVIIAGSSHKSYTKPTNEQEFRPSPRQREHKDKSFGKRQSIKGSSLCQKARMKGCIFVEEDNSLMSHWYTLTVQQETAVVLSIYTNLLPSTSQSLSKMEICALILRSGPNEAFIKCTESRNEKDMSSAEVTLTPGRYIVIPFTSGCHLHKREHSPKRDVALVARSQNNKHTLSRQYKSALGEIFSLCDLDGNGLLSREEFNLFNFRTSGEEIADLEWNVVKQHIELVNDEISLEGFFHLNNLEVEDNSGNEDDSWLTLSNMGFNNSLVLDEACGFTIDIDAEKDTDINLKVFKLESLTSETFQDKLIYLAREKGVKKQAEDDHNIASWTYYNEYWGLVLVENKTSKTVRVRLDYSESVNSTSSEESLIWTSQVMPKTTKIVSKFVSSLKSKPWKLIGNLTVI